MAYTADTLSKIKAVDFAMESFARYKDEGKRQEWLSFNIDAVQYLGIYFEYSKAELREEKKELREEMKELREIQINAQEIEMKKLKHQEEMGSKVKGEKK
jgi:sensor histidine kinase YesM